MGVRRAVKRVDGFRITVAITTQKMAGVSNLKLYLIKSKIDLINYLFVGGLNTVIGYCIGVSLLYLMSDVLITPIIGFLSTIIAVISNFILFKKIVFKTKDNWWDELFRFFKVYAVATVAGIFVLTISLDYLSLSVFVSQGFSMAVATTISAVGNFHFTFRR